MPRLPRPIRNVLAPGQLYPTIKSIYIVRSRLLFCYFFLLMGNLARHSRTNIQAAGIASGASTRRAFFLAPTHFGFGILQPADDSIHGVLKR